MDTNLSVLLATVKNKGFVYAKMSLSQIMADWKSNARKKKREVNWRNVSVPVIEEEQLSATCYY